ncbi:hypothetical protein [Aneurinibacillus migulanus]|uniref:Uncharacterized protein n=1 Tax=Aneurinibacillus migulanus TaxID=47500 RepID=A0A0D1YNT1_ANEMI|nr:hypothetical protein [Aneurinibacillus migulanus]KIV60297.1 hypothetical protein TS65_00480 [Aneurinibacillus migulanus]KON90505.1 hypothetical protein AF333_28925 [Aneurinibacillus migulanus]MED0894913.1 hypothetical protein [Aneurinibacillus migulanus]MED1614444.1 hypothetical protein [Aneurinibacillus migulanus]SDJ77523.1 hypothetical protein SAMN04487909_12844 [Aneurinibacillus migulanus]
MNNRNLRLAAPGEKTDFKMVIKALIDDLPNHIERCAILSQMMFEYKKALIKEGFTEVEALEIIKAHGARVGNL